MGKKQAGERTVLTTRLGNQGVTSDIIVSRFARLIDPTPRFAMKIPATRETRAVATVHSGLKTPPYF